MAKFPKCVTRQESIVTAHRSIKELRRLTDSDLLAAIFSDWNINGLVKAEIVYEENLNITLKRYLEFTSLDGNSLSFDGIEYILKELNFIYPNTTKVKVKLRTWKRPELEPVTVAIVVFMIG